MVASLFQGASLILLLVVYTVDCCYAATLVQMGVRCHHADGMVWMAGWLGGSLCEAPLYQCMLFL
jgi:hypothetical protein